MLGQVEGVADDQGADEVPDQGNAPEAGDPRRGDARLPTESGGRITTLASVNSAAPDRITKKNPAENPNPSSRRSTPGLSVPVASKAENSAPMVMNAPARMPSTNTFGVVCVRSRRAPWAPSSSITYSVRCEDPGGMACNAAGLHHR
jgi:hypothetical protein